MSEELLDQWEQDFRAAARADDCAMFREHLGRLSAREHLGRLLRPDEPQLMLEATIRIVRMCSAYATVDNRAEEFGRRIATFSEPKRTQGRRVAEREHAVTTEPAPGRDAPVGGGSPVRWKRYSEKVAR
jgi:hypothetical protein